MVQEEGTNLYGYIDATGEFVIEPMFYDAFKFAENGLAPVFDVKSGLLGYIDAKSKFVIEPMFYDGWVYIKVNK